MPEKQFDDVQPKPFEQLSLKEKLELAGIQVMPTATPERLVVDPYGIQESLELFDLLTTIANKVVNKDSFLDITLIQKTFVAYQGAKQIPKELIYLTESEVGVIQERIKMGLKFDNPDKAKLERLVETLTFAGLLILFGITSYMQDGNLV